jgi:phosphogluconate dehydratase
MIGELLDAGLLHDDVVTVAGDGPAPLHARAALVDGALTWAEGRSGARTTASCGPCATRSSRRGASCSFAGNLGRAVIKVSAVAPERQVIEAPARVFASQDAVKDAFKAGEFTGDVVVVVRYQGPKANGMPELHALTPVLAVLQDRGHKVALVTDGRMSGASGKVPAAIHVAPEAADGGALALLRDGDPVRLDARTGRLEVLTDLSGRVADPLDLSANEDGLGRDLFALFRRNVGAATDGAAAVL